MQVPFFDIKRQYHSIKNEIDNAIQEVLESGQFVLGPNVEAFEKEFADYCGSKYAVGVSSGTDALKLALISIGIKEGDEVITTPFTFVSTVDAISHTGAKPVFVDIEKDYFSIDADKIEENITEKTKAILPVHLYGHPAGMEKIMDIARKHNLKVIEDSCQAHGAELDGKKVGTFGDAGCFSFYPTKNLGAYGEGGMIIIDNKETAEKLRMLRHIGQKKKYHYEVTGFNNRLHEIQAAILRVKLKYLDQTNEQRRNHAKNYNKALYQTRLKLPNESPNAKHVYHLYVVQTKEREKLIKLLDENEIESMVHYPLPVHLQESYKYLGYKRGDFPVSEKCADEVISLPMYPELKDDEIDMVISNLKIFLEGSR